MKLPQSIKYKEVKAGSVKPVCGNRPMKKRGISGREVISFLRKMASQQKNERDLTIYTEQIPYLQKLIFND